VKNICVDLIEVSLLVGLGVGDFIMPQTTLKAASSKIVKHEKIFSYNQHACFYIICI
jgi:hypothetical protein